MNNKYEKTIFNPNVKFQIPIKKSYSKDYFIKVPIKEVGYISLSNLFLLLWYYSILLAFWFALYEKHFVTVNIITLINVFFSVIILLRENSSWKNTLDLVQIMFQYIKKKNIGLFKPKKRDILSKNQREYI